MAPGVAIIAFEAPRIDDVQSGKGRMRLDRSLPGSQRACRMMTMVAGGLHPCRHGRLGFVTSFFEANPLWLRPAIASFRFGHALWPRQMAAHGVGRESLRSRERCARTPIGINPHVSGGQARGRDSPMLHLDHRTPPVR